jgi:hypothetical protein
MVLALAVSVHVFDSLTALYMLNDAYSDKGCAGLKFGVSFGSGLQGKGAGGAAGSLQGKGALQGKGQQRAAKGSEGQRRAAKGSEGQPSLRLSQQGGAWRPPCGRPPCKASLPRAALLAASSLRPCYEQGPVADDSCNRAGDQVERGAAPVTRG